MLPKSYHNFNAIKRATSTALIEEICDIFLDNLQFQLSKTIYFCKLLDSKGLQS